MREFDQGISEIGEQWGWNQPRREEAAGNCG